MPVPEAYDTRFPPAAATIREVYDSRSPPIPSQPQQAEYYDPYTGDDHLHTYPTPHSPPTHSPSPVSAPHGLLHMDPNTLQRHGAATMRSPPDETGPYGVPFDTRSGAHEKRTVVGGQQQQQQHGWNAVIPESVEETSHSGEMLPEYNAFDPIQDVTQSTSSGSGVAYGVRSGYGYPREKQ